MKALEQGKFPPVGAVIYTKRLAYRHYGIYVGRGKVIHFTAGKNSEKSAKNADVRRTSLAVFLNGDKLFVEPEDPRKSYSPKETVARAESMLGTQKSKYSLVFNNCEHFAHWCKYGEKKSKQVRNALRVASFVAPTLSPVFTGIRIIETIKNLDET